MADPIALAPSDPGSPEYITWLQQQQQVAQKTNAIPGAPVLGLAVAPQNDAIIDNKPDPRERERSVGPSTTVPQDMARSAVNNLRALENRTLGRRQ